MAKEHSTCPCCGEHYFDKWIMHANDGPCDHGTCSNCGENVYLKGREPKGYVYPNRRRAQFVSSSSGSSSNFSFSNYFNFSDRTIFWLNVIKYTIITVCSLAVIGYILFVYFHFIKVVWEFILFMKANIELTLVMAFIIFWVAIFIQSITKDWIKYLSNNLIVVAGGWSRQQLFLLHPQPLLPPLA